MVHLVPIASPVRSLMVSRELAISYQGLFVIRSSGCQGIAAYFFYDSFEFGGQAFSLVISLRVIMLSLLMLGTDALTTSLFREVGVLGKSVGCSL